MIDYKEYLYDVSNSLRKDGFKKIYTDESTIYNELMRVKTVYTDTLNYKINLFAFKTRMFSEDIICFLLKCNDNSHEPLDLEKLKYNTKLLFDLGIEYATVAENDYHRKHRLVMSVFISDAPFSSEIVDYTVNEFPIKNTILLGTTTFTRVGAPILVSLQDGRVNYYAKRQFLAWNLFRTMDKFATKYFRPKQSRAT